MHRPRKFVLTAALGLVALAAAASAAGSSSGWGRISGPTQPGVQLGLARTGDGVLHVIWNRGAQSTSIFETRFSPAGRAVGTSTVAAGWPGNGGLALLVMPDGTLRLFTPGVGGINTFTAPAGGRSWTHQSVAGWGTAVAEAAAVIGASLTKDGQPVTAWRGDAAEGVPPASIPQNPFNSGMGESLLATDAGSGAIVLAGETVSGQGGAYVQQVLPGVGRPALLTPLAKDWSVGLSGRIGAPGVYVANADGKSFRLVRYGGATKTLAHGAFYSGTVCAGPEGRLWVAWGDVTDGVFVTRSNKAAGAFEPVQKLRSPSSNGLTFLQCQGSAGPVDVFADDGTGFWHSHLLGQLTVRAALSRGKATISVRDAGDPVAGAAVTIGGRHLHTALNGSASVSLRPGSYTATVSAAGYVTASVRVRA